MNQRSNPEPEHPDELPPDPDLASDPQATASSAQPESPMPRIRLTVPVPAIVVEALELRRIDIVVLAQRCLAALWRKHTPERGPADKGPYAGEICYFQRVLDAPSETRTDPERLFEMFNRWHEEIRELALVVEDDAIRRELAQATADMAEWVAIAQKLVRLERGEDAAQIDWKVTEP